MRMSKIVWGPDCPGCKSYKILSMLIQAIERDIERLTKSHFALEINRRARVESRFYVRKVTKQWSVLNCKAVIRTSSIGLLERSV